MSLEEIEKIITIAGSFGVGAILGGGVLYYFIKSYIPAYLTEKGKNLATKEDVGAITEEVEAVKSGYAEILEEVKVSNQLKVSAIQREQNIKKEVYMDAVEAITKSQNMIASFSNLNISEEKITSEFSEQAGKIAKVQIVGTKETVQAVTVFMGEVGTATLHLMLKRVALMNRKNDIQISGDLRDKCQSEVDRYLSIMKNMNLAGNRDQSIWEYMNKSFEFECEQRDKHNKEIDELWAIQNREYILYVRLCMATFFEISKHLPQAVLSVRSELGLEISHDDYLDIFNKNIEKGKAVFDDFLSKLEPESA
ncbi:hypothetical protein AYI83_18545 [Shewanella algae]|uniref:chromosome segregation ATPase n=1 Tax=Shewanella algae TaxID=38313 RepID=UPI0011824A19|nr:chromosome segregation ATPase [Shewanella algae]TVK92770.1 hypothetical protein AYI83_18545 [Shewanella algae]